MNAEELRTSISPLTLHHSTGNFLLDLLESESAFRITGKMQTVTFRLGEVLYEPGDVIHAAYFPTTAIVSVLHIIENGRMAEVAVIGNDGMFGIPLFLGGITTTGRAVIQSGGHAFKLNAEDLQSEFSNGGRFQKILLRYTQAMMTHTSQNVVCNRLHEVHEQLCKWLLLMHDRLKSADVKMTHELVANMLGVRREAVTVAAQRLAAQKLIRNTRGVITVLDRSGLENSACECYSVVNLEHNRLLGRGISRVFA